jgi:diketogulonate reductase-like aldo/keto reductase
MTTDITLYNGNLMPSTGLGTYRIEDQKTAAETVAAAIETGYRHIDTAAIYGNEEGVGQGIKDSGAGRDKVFLTTKIWNEDLRAGRIKEAFAESLKRLSTDYVDLLLVHWPTGNYTEYWKDFEELYREGSARNIGVSNFTMRMLDELLPVCEIKPAVNQVELHPFLTQKPLLKYCHSKEITLTAWSGFMVGKLLDNPDILRIAEKYGKTAAQIILRWNYQNRVISIPKSTKKRRLEENIDIFDFKIEFDDLKFIDGLNKNLRKGPNPEDFDF